jgi:uncharacterized protein YjdB
VAPTTEPTKAPVAKPDYTLLATMKTNGNNALKLNWSKVARAEGYDVFLKRCSAPGKYPVVGTVEAGKARTLTVKKLQKGKAYRAYVRAWRTVDGEKTYIGRPSPLVHAICGGYTKNYANPKWVNLKAASLTLEAGKSKTVIASVTGVKKGRKVLDHNDALLRWYSSNGNVATVDQSGKITATGAGKCTVWAVANNGVRTGVKVTVK